MGGRSVPGDTRTRCHRPARRIRQSLHGHDRHDWHRTQGRYRLQSRRLLAQVALTAVRRAQGRVPIERSAMARWGRIGSRGLAMIGMFGMGGHRSHRRAHARRMARQNQLCPYQRQHRQQRNGSTPAVAAEAVHPTQHVTPLLGTGFDLRQLTSPQGPRMPWLGCPRRRKWM